MLTWQSAEVVTEVDCSTKLQRVLSWVSDTGRTHGEKPIENELALHAYSVFTIEKIALSCQKPPTLSLLSQHFCFTLPL